MIQHMAHPTPQLYTQHLPTTDPKWSEIGRCTRTYSHAFITPALAASLSTPCTSQRPIAVEASRPEDRYCRLNAHGRNVKHHSDCRGEEKAGKQLAPHVIEDEHAH